MKHSFRTRAYRDGWIRSCVNRATDTEEIRVQFNDGRTRSARSVRAAQLMLNAAARKVVAA